MKSWIAVEVEVEIKKKLFPLILQIALFSFLIFNFLKLLINEKTKIYFLIIEKNKKIILINAKKT